MAHYDAQANVFFAGQETSSSPADVGGSKPTNFQKSHSFSVLLFASLKDAVAASVIEVRVAEAEPTVTELLACCAVQFPALEPYLPFIRVAVNCEYSNEQQTLRVNDEIAFIPPVSGGCAENLAGDNAHVEERLLPLVLISAAPIDTIQVARSAEICLRGGSGAVVTFEGVVRNNAAGHQVQYLEYSAYEPMAARELRRISEEVQNRWQLPCALVHRIGRLESVRPALSSRWLLRTEVKLSRRAATLLIVPKKQCLSGKKRWRATERGGSKIPCVKVNHHDLFIGFSRFNHPCQTAGGNLGNCCKCHEYG
jgi:molybdopterin synthase catalytic subunit